MSPIIENHITVTRDFFFEWLKANQTPSYKKMMRMMTIGLIVVFALVFGYFVYRGGSPLFLLGEFAFMVGITIYVLRILPNMRNKNKYKALCQGSKNLPERTIRFYENHISVTTEFGKSKDFSYDCIHRFRETEHLYILVDNTQVGIILDKKGFVKGSIEEVKELLPEECLS